MRLKLSVRLTSSSTLVCGARARKSPAASSPAKCSSCEMGARMARESPRCAYTDTANARASSANSNSREITIMRLSALLSSMAASISTSM